MNRAQRRLSQSYHSKIVKQSLAKNDWGQWEDKTVEARAKAMGKNAQRLIGFYANKVYSVQKFDANGKILLGIRRNDQSINVPWADKYRIKNELSGYEHQAIEVYPPESELIDSANMYWLWVLPIHIGCNLKEAIEGVYRD